MGSHHPAPAVDQLADLPAKAILDEHTLASAFQVSTRTIARWVKRGDLPPPAAFGGRKIWMAGKILAFIEQRILEAEGTGLRTTAATNRAQTP